MAEPINNIRTAPNSQSTGKIDAGLKDAQTLDADEMTKSASLTSNTKTQADEAGAKKSRKIDANSRLEKLRALRESKKEETVSKLDNKDVAARNLKKSSKPFVGKQVPVVPEEQSDSFKKTDLKKQAHELDMDAEPELEHEKQDRSTHDLKKQRSREEQNKGQGDSHSRDQGSKGRSKDLQKAPAKSQSMLEGAKIPSTKSLEKIQKKELGKIALDKAEDAGAKQKALKDVIRFVQRVIKMDKGKAIGLIAAYFNKLIRTKLKNLEDYAMAREEAVEAEEDLPDWLSDFTEQKLIKPPARKMRNPNYIPDPDHEYTRFNNTEARVHHWKLKYFLRIFHAFGRSTERSNLVESNLLKYQNYQKAAA